MRIPSTVCAAACFVVLAGCYTAPPRAEMAALAPTNVSVSSAPPVTLDRVLRDTVAWYRNEWMLPGAAFATFTCDSRRLAWDGVTRVDGDSPIGPHALFRLEYHAAPMLATAALRLERRGVLRLDAPLRELWPSAARSAPWYADITLGTLLSFVPPIPAYGLGDSASLVPAFTASRGRSAAYHATRWYLAQQPDSIPSRARSSAPAVVVAAGILEHVTGKSIAQLLHDDV